MANRDHIETLFKSHYPQLHRLAAVMLRDDEQAADIVQDLFASLLHSRGEQEISAGYLVRAVRNRCLNRIESLGIREKVRNLYFLETENYDTENWPYEETLALINEIIASDLTPQKRQIMGLCFGEGMPFKKVAEKLEISETANSIGVNFDHTPRNDWSGSMEYDGGGYTSSDFSQRGYERMNFLLL